ncbi:ATP-binding cassette domain-containing protein [Orbaceae bacterium ESL0721]|nr:ATP-binding cassette domain-containing protein [Orbaceae bacterium ESL0721]
MNNLSTKQLDKTPLLSAKHLCKTYKEGSLVTEVLKDVTFDIYPKSLLAIIGSSGSGKSTLLHLLGGLDRPSLGEIIFQSQKMSALSETEKAALRNKKLALSISSTTFYPILPP